MRLVNISGAVSCWCGW